MLEPPPAADPGPGETLRLPCGLEDRDPERFSILAHAPRPGHQSKLRAKRQGMTLKDFQIHLPQRDLLILGPDQQNPRRLGPRHAVAYGDEIVVRFERDDLRLHAARL